MAEWVYFIYVDREDFAATMTPEEDAVWDEHFDGLRKLLSAGSLILAGPTLGRVNTGIIIFEARDEESARAIMQADPTVARGFARGELRPMRVALLRGRD